MLIDVHCHVYGEKLDGLLARAGKNNVGVIVNSGANIEANRTTLKLSRKFKEFYATMGLYPSDALKMSAEEIEKEINFIRKHSEEVVAISEVGMDFKMEEERERQEKIFRKFVSLALELDKPIIVHSRKAEAECIEILEDMKAKKVVMHCFSGRKKLVERIVSNGWFLSVPTCVTRSEQFQNLVRIVPLKQLLCETDSPYLHPLGKDAGENEPANVIASYEKIASLKGIKFEEVEKLVEGNFRELFNMPVRKT